MNLRERASCTEEVEANEAARPPTEEEERRCEELLETCDCEDLEREAFAECGLTTSTDPSL